MFGPVSSCLRTCNRILCSRRYIERGTITSCRRLISVSPHLMANHQQDKMPFSITRIYTDENGESRFGQFQIQMEGSGDIGYLSKVIKSSGIQFRYTPANYHYSWHGAPQRQFIVNLDADVEVEVSSGEKRVLKQGEVFFVEDLTGKGHYSRAVSNKPRRSLFLIVGDDFQVEDL